MTAESPPQRIDALRPKDLPPSIRDGYREALNGLKDGLLRPSVCAVVIACTICFLAFLGLAIALRPQFIAGQSHGYLAATSADYDAFVTSKILTLQTIGTRGPLLVLLGGSTTRASLLESDLMKGLHESGLSDWSVVKLCTSRQSLWETLALADNLPLGAEGVVVIGVGAPLFTMGDADLKELASSPRLGIRSRALDDEFRRHGLPVSARTGIHLIDNAGFFLPRLDKMLESRLHGSSTEYADSQYLGSRPVSEDTWASKGERVSARFTDLDTNWARNLAVLARIIDLISERTAMQVILVETPVNPRFTDEFGRTEDVNRHRQRMGAFARDRSVPYIILNDVARLTKHDFVDWAHLHDPSAIDRCADAVLDSIRRLMAPSAPAKVN